MVTGETLADELQTKILQIKINTIADKIAQYFKDQDEIDIPDFMKPFDLRLSTFIERSINRMYETNSIDYFYKLALGEAS